MSFGGPVRTDSPNDKTAKSCVRSILYFLGDRRGIIECDPAVGNREPWHLSSRIEGGSRNVVSGRDVSVPDLRTARKGRLVCQIRPCDSAALIYITVKWDS